MSATRLYVLQTSSNPSLEIHGRFRSPSFLHQTWSLSSSSSNLNQILTSDFVSFYPTISRVPLTKIVKKFVVHNDIQSGTPVPSGNPSHSWKGWIVGILLSVLLPFYKHKLNPLLALKNKVETIFDTAELVLDVVEKVAEEVEEIADDLGNKLPEGGKLKGAVDMVENVAREIAKDANIAEDLIEKVEKVEKEVGSFIEPVITGQEKKVTKEAGHGSINQVDNSEEVPTPEL